MKRKDPPQRAPSTVSSTGVSQPCSALAGVEVAGMAAGEAQSDADMARSLVWRVPIVAFGRPPASAYFFGQSQIWLVSKHGFTTDRAACPGRLRRRRATPEFRARGGGAASHRQRRQPPCAKAGGDARRRF